MLLSIMRLHKVLSRRDWTETGPGAFLWHILLLLFNTTRYAENLELLQVEHRELPGAGAARDRAPNGSARERRGSGQNAARVRAGSIARAMGSRGDTGRSVRQARATPARWAAGNRGSAA